MCYTDSEEGEDRPITVMEYIYYALKEDGLSFRQELHRMILDEGMAHLHEEGFTAERFFLNHEDNRISMLAFELNDDKYQLSKYHSKAQKVLQDDERLMDLVSHLMEDFKLAIVKEELKELLLQLRNPGILSNPEEYMKVMQHYKELKDIECTLSKERGDRVIS